MDKTSPQSLSARREESHRSRDCSIRTAGVLFGPFLHVPQLTRLIKQANLENLDSMSARHRTLNYEHERLQKNYLGSKTNNVKLQAEVAGWKAKCADLEKRLGQEEVKVKELREEVSRGRKAIDGVRVAASVSYST